MSTFSDHTQLDLRASSRESFDSCLTTFVRSGHVRGHVVSEKWVWPWPGNMSTRRRRWLHFLDIFVNHHQSAFSGKTNLIDWLNCSGARDGATMQPEWSLSDGPISVEEGSESVGLQWRDLASVRAS